MKIKLVMATATALTALMSAGALADDNWASVVQYGDDNSADVEQASTGSDNQTRIFQGKLGANGDNNIVIVSQDGSGNQAGFQHYGDNQWTLRQFGHNNLIDIDQTGNNNRVGMSNAQPTAGVQQTGSFNSITIDQTNPGHAYSENHVGAIAQVAALTATAATNVLVIDQNPGTSLESHRPRHNVSYVSQTNTGAGTDALLANSVTINQLGGGHDNPNGNDGNGINRVIQNGTANVAALTQDGFANRIGIVTQLGANNSTTIDQFGKDNVVVSVTQDNTGSGSIGNTADLSFTGDLNGTGAFSGAADGVALTEATVVQLGDNNGLTYTVVGNSNLFAFNQTGDNNTVTGNVDGDLNQAAVSQAGNANFSFLQQNGSNNNIGIMQ